MRPIPAFLLSLPLCNGDCGAWCSNRCSELNGDVQLECESCSGPAYSCRPGEPGFSTVPLSTGKVEKPTQAYSTVSPDGFASPVVDTRPCARVSATDLLGLTPEDLAERLAEPTIITGMLSDWPLQKRDNTASLQRVTIDTFPAWFLHAIGEEGVAAMDAAEEDGQRCDEHPMKVFSNHMRQVVALRKLVVSNEYVMLEGVMAVSKKVVTRMPKMQWVVLSTR